MATTQAPNSTIYLCLDLMSFSIFVNFEAEKHLTILFVSSDDVLENIKRQVLEKEGVPVELQSLSICGEALQDGRSLRSYFVNPGDVLLLEVAAQQLAVNDSKFLSKPGDSPAHIAIRENNVQALLATLDAHPSCLYRRNKRGDSLLTIACEHGIKSCLCSYRFLQYCRLSTKPRWLCTFPL